MGVKITPDTNPAEQEPWTVGLPEEVGYRGIVQVQFHFDDDAFPVACHDDISQNSENPIDSRLKVFDTLIKRILNGPIAIHTQANKIAKITGEEDRAIIVADNRLDNFAGFTALRQELDPDDAPTVQGEATFYLKFARMKVPMTIIEFRPRLLDKTTYAHRQTTMPELDVAIRQLAYSQNQANVMQYPELLEDVPYLPDIIRRRQ